ncbi:zinc-finger domain-containing protein [Marinivivus vitaminiproducens]|uniref:zinc-finger domain-containing protein n=1 Tax=Marinivivus vitaminiproducens TaxID=3035935 RepID=UPI00279F0C9A|nr:zinc-finger domain-containing protein [Geminicoccaceae bacterium SCSIO 64248]
MNQGQEFFLVDDREVVISQDLYVCCDGGTGALGHPREYMTLTRHGGNRCGYCSRLFLHAGHADEAMVREKGIPLPNVVAAA